MSSAKSTFEVDDRTDAAIVDIEDAVNKGLEAAGLYAETQIKRSMPLNPAVEAGEGGWKKSFGHRMRSMPGEPPMQQTGNLARAITSGLTGHLKAAVGTRKGYSDVPYGYFLDQGTAKMQRRPWLGRMFERRKKQINEHFERGFKRAMRGKPE